MEEPRTMVGWLVISDCLKKLQRTTKLNRLDTDTTHIHPVTEARTEFPLRQTVDRQMFPLEPIIL